MDDHGGDLSGTQGAARAALDLLRDWVQTAPPEARAALAADLRAALGADLSRLYPADFSPDAAYRASLPDLQNGPESAIRGARRAIEEVGIAGFRMPLRYEDGQGGAHLLETSITGSVSLAAHKKGINMSRIMRSFYARADAPMDFARLGEILAAYRADLDSFDARLQLRLAWPELRPSLRSGLAGYQYYDITMEMIDAAGVQERHLHLDYVYASTCPCSLELAEHARATRGQLATPHSQRSVARISVQIRPGAALPFGDLIGLCRAAVPTETQVMVKREDEQAFAELNAANPIFVEDAARLFAEALAGDPRIGDFRVAASHQESLHSHDAIALLCHGPRFAGPPEPRLFASLTHASRA